MRFILLFVMQLPCLCAITQNNLSGSRKAGPFSYVYQLTNKEVLTLHRKGIRKVNESFLHTKIDSIPSENEFSLKKPGNYLIVSASRNQLYYVVRNVPAIQYKLINNKYDLALFIHDKYGVRIADAKVKLDNSNLPYDQSTNSYRLPKTKRGGLLRIEYKDILHCYRLVDNEPRRRRETTLWWRMSSAFPLKYFIHPSNYLFRRKNGYATYFHSKTRHEEKFNGFLVFNKPVYKPGDTVRLKAFISNTKGKPINRRLLVRLTDNGFSIDTIIGYIQPYRAGGYTFEWVLSDKLDLDLDEEYLVTLEEEKSIKYDVDEYEGNLDEDQYALKRKVLKRGTFEYEEYELSSVTFTGRTDKKVHNLG